MRFSKIVALFGVVAGVLVVGLVVSLGDFPVEIPPRVTGVVIGCNPGSKGTPRQCVVRTPAGADLFVGIQGGRSGSTVILARMKHGVSGKTYYVVTGSVPSN